MLAFLFHPLFISSCSSFPAPLLHLSFPFLLPAIAFSVSPSSFLPVLFVFPHCLSLSALVYLCSTPYLHLPPIPTCFLPCNLLLPVTVALSPIPHAPYSPLLTLLIIMIQLSLPLFLSPSSSHTPSYSLLYILPLPPPPPPLLTCRVVPDYTSWNTG